MEQKIHSYKFMAISGWALALVVICISIANGAWSPATANPTGGNPEAPINASSNAQTKLGGLTLNGAFNAATSSLFGGTATFNGTQAITANGLSLFTGATTAASGALQITSADPSIRLKTTGAGVGVDKNTMEIRNISNHNSGLNYLQFRTVNDANNVFTERLSLSNTGGMHLGSTYNNPGATNLTIQGAVGISTNTLGAYKLNVSGDANATRLCIAGDCKDTWPTGGSGGGVPASGIIFSQDQVNPLIEMQGFTLMTAMGMPYTVTASAGMGNPLPLYLFQKQ